jgi:hypothetical protein
MGRGGEEEPHVHTPMCLHREDCYGGTVVVQGVEVVVQGLIRIKCTGLNNCNTVQVRDSVKVYF